MEEIWGEKKKQTNWIHIKEELKYDVKELIASFLLVYYCSSIIYFYKVNVTLVYNFGVRNAK